jgi:hypothetical protein
MAHVCAKPETREISFLAPVTCNLTGTLEGRNYDFPNFAAGHFSADCYSHDSKRNRGLGGRFRKSQTVSLS